MEEYSYTSTHPLGHTGPVTASLYLHIIKGQILEMRKMRCQRAGGQFGILIVYMIGALYCRK
jgi:hypothetical protein